MCAVLQPCGLRGLSRVLGRCLRALGVAARYLSRVCSEASCVRVWWTREYVHTWSPGLPRLTCVPCSLVCWPSSEGTLHWPDLLSDPSIVGNTLQRLARGRLGRTLGPEEDSLSLVSPSSPAKYFSASGEQGWGGVVSSCSPQGGSEVGGRRGPRPP